ncbi:hypothetical protein Tco_1304183 [Tanacetum coccineum]
MKIPFRLRELIECRGETPVYAAIGGGCCRRDSPAIRVTSESVDFVAMLSNDDRVSVNDEDTSSIAAKIRDMERRMLEGKLVLSGDDQEPLNPLNADG